MQAAEHLLGEFRRDLGLRVAALLQERRQAPLGRVVVQAEGVERELEAAEHRPAGDRRQRAQRKGQPAARLALRRVDEAKLVIREQNPGAHAGFVLAQQPLEALVRRRLPAGERAALIRRDARLLDADEQCRPAFRIDHRPMRFEDGVRLVDRDRQSIRQRPTARQAGHLMLAPAQDSREECPRIGERSRLALRREARGDRIAVRARLLLGHEAIAVENGRAEDEADGLDIAEPFEIRIDDGHVSCSSARGARGRRSPAGRRRHRSRAARAPARSRSRGRGGRISPASGGGRGAPARPRPDRTPG